MNKKLPCPGCKHYLHSECDILGEITDENLKICKKAGYMEAKTLGLYPIYRYSNGAIYLEIIGQREWRTR